jgi:hypothetical protein
MHFAISLPQLMYMLLDQSVSFLHDWILHTLTFYYYETTVTFILYIPNKVWVEIYYLWLGLLTKSGINLSTFTSWGGLKISCSSRSSNEGNLWFPRHVRTPFLAIFTMCAVLWISVSLVCTITLGLIPNQIPSMIILGLKGKSLEDSLRHIARGCEQSCPFWHYQEMLGFW